MTEQEKYVLAASAVFKDCLSVLNQRSLKYTGTGDPFARIYESADIADVTPVQGIMTRFGDKVGRLKLLLKQELPDGVDTTAVDESLDDTLHDAINYLVILKIFLASGGGADLDRILQDAGLSAGPQLKLPTFAESEDTKPGWFEKIFKN